MHKRIPIKHTDTRSLFSRSVKATNITDIENAIKLEIETNDVTTEVLEKVSKHFNKVETKWRATTAIALVLDSTLVKLIHDNNDSYFFTGITAGIIFLLTFSISWYVLCNNLKNACKSIDTILTDDEKSEIEITLNFLRNSWKIDANKDPLKHEHQNQQLLIMQIIRNELKRRQQENINQRNYIL